MIGLLSAHLWQSTLFALAAALLTLAFRSHRAKVRYGLWLSASLKFLVPFGWLIGLGKRLKWAPAAHGIATAQVSWAVERITQPFAYAAPAAAARAPVHWGQIAIAGVWACGFLAIASVRVRQWRRIRAAVRGSARVDMAAAVEVRSSPALFEPGVVGLLRPVLLLPEGIFERLTAAQLEAVLAHEFCHVRRRDNLFAGLHMVVEAVFWFHPLVWWIGARMVEERERACDEGVLSLGNEPRAYADAILNVCKLYVESPLACVPGVTGANLKRRIEAILARRTGRGLSRARKLLLAAAAAAAVAGPVGVGVLIGTGNAPVLQARPAAQAQQAAQETSADQRYRDRRLVALFFDVDTMSGDEQSRAIASGLDYVGNRLQPADLAAVMTMDRGVVKVVQDFTADRAALASAVQKLSAAGGGSGADPSLQIAHLEAATRILGVLPQKKALVYYAGGSGRAASDPALRSAIQAAVEANVAIYPMDARGQAAGAGWGPGGGRSMSSPLAPPGVSADEYQQRRETAHARFGSSSAMARTYIRYGQPDEIVNGGPHGAQTWRYHYLENFHSNVEFEFTPGRGPGGVRINWPPPEGTFLGVPGAAANAVAGLPGRHASVATYPAGEIQTLTVPLDSLSGEVGIEAGVQRTPTAGTGAGAGLKDRLSVDQYPSGVYVANLVLPAGDYICNLVVREQATGQAYAETIHFEVK